MKKGIALLFVAMLLVGIMASAFAGPDTCPVDGCNGTYRRQKVKVDWHWVDHKEKRRTGPMGQVQIWTQEERTVCIYCSKKTHTVTETRNGRWRDLSWIEGFFN